MAYIRKLFGSLISRMLLLTIVSVVLAQSLTSLFWVTQIADTEKNAVIANAQNLANSAVSTISFFQKLPNSYRHLVLEQLRDLGGSRFFVSLNKKMIDINPINDSDLKQQVLRDMKSIVQKKLGEHRTLYLEFSSPDDLHVINNNILLKDLPPSWGAYSLMIPSVSPPILVLQMELGENEWLYLAAVLPPPYLLDDPSPISTQQFVSITVTTFILLTFIYLIFYWQTQPLKNLASAVGEFSIDFTKPPLVEQGATEIVAATRAFNHMQQKLQSYIKDREEVFRSISHDLKTPITRLRLRAELLEDEKQTDAFNVDLEDLEMLVKAALQTVKDTNIHENIDNINIDKLLKQIVGTQKDLIRLHINTKDTFRGKPHALKRALSNVIDNGVKYGGKVDVFVKDSAHSLVITVRDQGPGIAESDLSSIFTPYVRLHNDKQGHGLGLGIARNIIQAHGGEIHLFNHPQGGLAVCVILPRAC
ncbi:ATP-binding protein [Psychromonas sp. 14N.309.X.WAT.B.A12]|uniref:ATP-binding protein n=1 Tax=unclassified Psychromonas TaxID=2614957 RepID=UPI0025B15047|nr:ATP-binding protein [Psychromonas sp. 14N.309.X.WAT.B.A12]MDN2663138.1 ATP-binding protein [Psychromonas sp. 14N.309.X.WAT.B.A12]